MSSTEHSKTAVLLLLIHCLLLPPLFYVCVCGGGGGMFGPWLAVHYLVSSFAIISLGMKDNWLLYFNCLLMSFDS